MNKILVVAIIPARGGSVRLPRKNLRTVGGVSLVARAVRQAQGAKLVDRVFVATEDSEIAAVARNEGAGVVNLPSILAQGEPGSHLKAMEWTIGHLEKYKGLKPGVVVLVQPTSPLRSSEDIDKSVQLLLDTGADTVLSVSGKKDFSLYKPEDYLSQIDEPENGAVYVNRRYVLMEQHAWAGKRIEYYHMPAERAIDIDTEADLDRADMILAGGLPQPAVHKGWPKGKKRK